MGSAAENHPQSMGIYVRQEEVVHNCSPVYKKHMMDKFIFLSKTGNWMVASKLGGNTGNIFQESRSFPLPLEHVEWFSANPDESVGFEVDRSLKVTPKQGRGNKPMT